MNMDETLANRLGQDEPSSKAVRVVKILSALATVLFVGALVAHRDAFTLTKHGSFHGVAMLIGVGALACTYALLLGRLSKAGQTFAESELETEPEPELSPLPDMYAFEERDNVIRLRIRLPSEG